jgi:penicillin-binding protein 2
VPGVAASATAARAASPGRSPAVDLREPRSVAQSYVDRWNAKDYNGMYELITGADQGTITRERFARRYENIAAEAGLAAVKATLGQPAPGTTQYPVRVEMTSSFVGPIAEDNTLAVRQDGGQWRVAWTPALIFKDLGDGLIRFNPDLPARGRILDRKGRPLAQQGTVSQVGLIPEGIKDEAQFLDVLSKTLGLTPEEIKAKYATAQPNWYVPLKILPDPLPPEIEAQLKPVQGVAVRKVRDRVYPQGALAAHVVGYLGRVTEEELKTLAARGYTADDRIGRAGIEAWGEQYLAGKKGGQLTVVGQDEKFRALIAERKSEPAADITLTLDLDLQRALEEGLGDRPASGVILDPRSGGVLAMAAHPTYDPNGFILGFDDATWARLNDEAQRPLWNRAVQFAYPPGSIFKVITATAAVERLGMTPQTTIPCPAEYTLPGSPNVWKDWTYPNAQGPMTLQTSITRSCNTVNYELGRQLDARDSNTLPEFARAFGLGKPTGLEELPEARGTVPDPQWKRQTLNDGWATGDAINLAIGQGFLLTTPLQMANLYNALANGGVLLRPFLAAAVTTPDGKVVRATERQETGRLPVPPATRAMLHTAMVDVISAPNGTAVKPFVGAPLAIAGKTGTAEVPPNPFHGWFASYAPAEAPQLTVLTMVENGGAGSEVAAPIARVVYDAYAALTPAP